MTKKGKRRPLSREMLLPVPVNKARALSLEYHIALSLLASGRGDLDQAARLMQAICHARFFGRSDEAELRLLDEAESAVNTLAGRADSGCAWTVTDTEHAAIAAALSVHDRLTAREPYHRFLDAWARVVEFGMSAQTLRIDG